MNDFLLELGKNPRARKVVESLGLPIPMPQVLSRVSGALEERPLANKQVVVSTTPNSTVASSIARSLAQAGADPYLSAEPEIIKHFAPAGEAFGRPPIALGQEGEPKRFDGLLLDATSFRTVDELAKLHRFFQPLVRRLNRCGRVVVVARAPGQDTLEGAIAQSAVDGFVRSTAKEIGRRGATAQLIRLEKGAEPRLGGVLRFVLSEASAYITGQPITVSKTARALKGEAPFADALSGKVALVTGAARGIGEATARILAREGARVVCLDRPEDDGPTSRLAREIGGTLLLADVAANDAPAKIGSFLHEMGGVDIVVHNAGITRDKTLGRMKDEQWDRVLKINLDAVTRITRALLDGVLKNEGRLICLSSISGLAGNMGQTNYTTSKAGIIGLVRFLASRMAERGITVNAIAPGFIETRMTAVIPMAIREVGRRLNNLGQGGLPEDVGQAINFLASPHAQGVTGQVLRVCGGSLIGA